MPSSDVKSRNYVHSATGIWTPVGYSSGDVPMPTSLSNPSNPPGLNVSVTPFGSLSVTPDPNFAFNDTFEGTTFDTVNRWNTYGTVAPTQTGGNLTTNPATTASATVAVATQPGITISNPLTVVGNVAFETGTTALGNHRFWGLGSVTGNVGTSGTPLTDAIGFEVDTAGVLRASVYNNGARVFTQILTMSTDGFPHLYMMMVRGDVTMFYRDNYTIPVATTYNVSTTQVLPFRVHSLNSASVTGTPTMVSSAVSVLDVARMTIAVADGTFPWRRAKIDATGAVNVTPRAADLAVSTTGASAAIVTATLPAAGPGLFHYITGISMTKYATAATTASATPIVVTTTNLPGSMAYTFDTAQVSGATLVRTDDFVSPLKSSVANTATTIVCPGSTSIIWRVNVSYYTAP